jgi:hypothetical protein
VKGAQRRLLALIAALALALPLAACVSATNRLKTGGTAGATGSALGLTGLRSERAAVLEQRGFCPAGVLKLRYEPLPAHFDVDAVYECQQTDATVAGRGQWFVEDQTKASSRLGRLLSALRRPDQPPPGGGVSCPADEVVAPLLVVVGRRGVVLRPAIPTDVCQQTQPAVFEALGKLRWTVVHRQLLHQIETPAEVASGCPPSYEDLFDTNASDLRAAGPGTAISGHPASLTVCAYRDTNPALNHPDGPTILGSQIPVGRFVAGGRVSGGLLTVLLAALRPGRRSAGCTREQPEFALVIPTGGQQTNTFVELGGCDRVLRLGLRPGRQPETDVQTDSIGQATPRGITILEHAVSPAG